MSLSLAQRGGADLAYNSPALPLQKLGPDTGFPKKKKKKRERRQKQIETL